MNRAMKMATGSALLAATSDSNALQIAPGFANLAGSRENALALVQALHDGRSVKLTLSAEPGCNAEVAAIESPTGAMSWKDVKMALMLARDALLRYGILHPTGSQLQAALAGGDATAPNGRLIVFRGVLCMRAEGMNWGRIAAERFLRPHVASGRVASIPPELVPA